MSALDLNCHIFLFENDKIPTTARRVHIRRLYDILQLSIQRNDLCRAKRAWSILARCKEVSWKAMWTTAMFILANGTTDDGDSERINYLRSMILQCPDECERILKELVICLISTSRYREAADELQLYLPSFPYQDNTILHILAGMTSLFLARISSWKVNGHAFDLALLRDAQTYFERALVLDSHNIYANMFLAKIPAMMRRNSVDQESDGENDIMTGADRPLQHFKRTRTELS